MAKPSGIMILIKVEPNPKGPMISPDLLSLYPKKLNLAACTSLKLFVLAIYQYLS